MRRPALLAAAALVGVAACGGSHAPKSGGGTGAADGPASAQTFTVHGNDRDQFSPQTIVAKVGTLTLTLQNGGVPHNLTFQNTSLPSIGVVSGASTKSSVLNLSAPGTFMFVCTIHPGMQGKLVVSA
jgi:plastocyanin